MLGLGLGLTAVRRPPAGTILLGPNFLSPLVTFSRASGATDTDAAGNIVVYGEDVPRYGYDLPTGLDGWLLEGSATNLCLWSEDLGAAAWTHAGTSVKSGDVGGPLGPMQKLVATATTTTHFLRQIIAVQEGKQYLVSFYAKAAEEQAIHCRVNSNAAFGGAPISAAGFNLTTGNASIYNVAEASGMIPVGDGIYRCWYRTVPALASDANTTFQFVLRQNSSYAGDGVSGLYLTGFNIVEGNTLSSYIPAEDAAATRAPDSLSITGSAFASLFGAGAPQGCVVVDVFLPAAAGTALRTIFSLDDGTSANRLDLRPGTSGTSLVAVPFFGGSQGSNPSIGGTVYGTQIRAGLRWGQGSIGICLNGVSIDSRPATLAAFNAARFGNTVLGTSPQNGRTSLARALAYAPADAEFKFICTPGT